MVHSMYCMCVFISCQPLVACLYMPFGKKSLFRGKNVGYRISRRHLVPAALFPEPGTPAS